MFTNQEIIAILFKFINFFALIGVGLFLFKKHILPDLMLSIATKKEAQESLYAQQAMLEKQQYNLDIFLKEDALKCTDFRANIDTWKKVVDLEHLEYEKKYNIIAAAINQRNMHKALQQENKRIQHLVTHGVVHKIQQSLSLYFKDQKKSAEYLHAILQFMDEKKS